MGLSNLDKHELKEAEMSASVASIYVRKMVHHESRTAGDTEGALARLERKYGIGYWQLKHLKAGKAKTVEAGLFQRIRLAYLDLCERQIAALQHDLATERAIEPNDIIEDLDAETKILAAKIKAAKQKR
jgi:hypothetical protein